MNNPFKLLIVSGCSFTANKCWPYHLNEKFEDTQLKNYGLISSGNGRISRSIIYGVSQALKTYSPEEILVGIMWSHPSRYDVFKENIDSGTFTNTSDNINPNKFIPEADENWLLIHSGWDDLYSKNYYSYFYDDIGNHITTLEHILRVQWYLKLHNVNYFMSTYSTGVLPNQELQNNPNINHLYNIVDWSKFLPVASCLEWTETCGIPTDQNELDKPFYMRHPSDEQHKEFSEKVIYPFIKSKYFVDKT